jgi:zinc transport system substrate-binding protein
MALILTAGCSPREEGGTAGRPVYVATIKPLALILSELVAGRAEVRTLLSPAASPHTYEPRPSDARAVAGALAFFQVGVGLDDWATSMQSKELVAVMEMLPVANQMMMEPGGCTDHGHDHAGHDHGALVVDPHFWTDPLATAAVVPALVAKLATLDPAGAAVYQANGAAFVERLKALDAALRDELASIKGAPVVLFHPSFLYMLSRYELRYVGVIEASPGKEATPRYLAALGESLRREGVRAIFTEPQLNPRPAEALAREAGVRLAILDPNGSVAGSDTYASFLLTNARALRLALQ